MLRVTAADEARSKFDVYQSHLRVGEIHPARDKELGRHWSWWLHLSYEAEGEAWTLDEALEAVAEAYKLQRN